MKNHTVTNTLAVTGALIVLFGVSFAASTALADETGKTDHTAKLATEATEQSLTEARHANEAAVVEAAKAVADATESNLDIRLSDHKLMLVARSR